MKVERIRPTVVRVTAHTVELSTLTAAARWALEGAPGELPDDVREQIAQVLARYDEALADLEKPGAEASGGGRPGHPPRSGREPVGIEPTT